MAMAMMYTVLLTRLGSNSLYRSTNCSCLQDAWCQGLSAAPTAPALSQGSARPWWPQANACTCMLLPPPITRDAASSGCPMHPMLGWHLLFRAPGLCLTV